MKQQRETIDEELRKIETKYTTQWNRPGDRDRFIADIEREANLVNGLWRNKASGAQISDIEAHMVAKLQRGSYTRLRNFNLKYVSPYARRSPETAAKHKAEVKRLLLEQIEKSRIVFKSENAKTKIVDLIAQNFLIVDGREGPLFHKINDESIPSPNGWTMDELFRTTGAAQYIDQDRTELTQRMHEYNLREEARKMAVNPKNDAEILGLMDKLRELDGSVKVGRVLNFDGKELVAELRKKAIIEFGKDESSLTLQEIHAIDARAHQEYEALNSLEPISQGLSDIVSGEETQQWEF